MSSVRKLAAIMFTDIVGYTAIMGRDEVKAYELLKKNKEIQKPIVDQHNGQWIKEMGDGILLSFNTVSDAVTAAIEIHKQCHAIDSLRLRIGIHLGEVLFEEGDVFGDGVNIASRLQMLAPPGGIYVSESVERNVENKRGFRVEYVRKEKLRNVSKAEKVYQLLPDRATVPGRADGQMSAPARKRVMAFAGAVILLLAAGYILFPGFVKNTVAGLSGQEGIKSIAVMPFKLIGNDEAGRYFAEGVADALINHLHGIDNLNVRSRTSVENVGTNKTTPEIARALDVEYVIEGSTQKYGDDIRVIVQLIDPKTDNHLWFKEYNEKYEDILRIQSEIALNIVSELHIPLSGSKRSEIRKKPTHNLEAWDLFTRGKEYHRAYWRYRGLNDIRYAIDFYSRAIEKDTTFALAYIHLARAIWAEQSAQIDDNPSVRDSMVLLINKAIRLDPDLPDAYALLGRYTWFIEDDIESGLQSIEKAIQMRPEDQRFVLLKGEVAAYQDDHLRALAVYKEALEKDLSEEYPRLLHAIGWSYLCTGEFGLANIFIRKALEQQPDDIVFLSHLAHLQMMMGRYDELLETVNKSLSVRKDNIGLVDKGKAYLLLGEYADAEKAYAHYFGLPADKQHRLIQEKSSYAYVLRRLGKEKEAKAMILEAKIWIEANMTDGYYDLAKVHAFLGDNDKALSLLKQWKPDWGLHAWVDRDPLFESLHDLPEFKRLVVDLVAEIGELNKKVDEKVARGEFPTPQMIK